MGRAFTSTTSSRPLPDELLLLVLSGVLHPHPEANSLPTPTNLYPCCSPPPRSIRLISLIESFSPGLQASCFRLSFFLGGGPSESAFFMSSLHLRLGTPSIFIEFIFVLFRSSTRPKISFVVQSGVDIGFLFLLEHTEFPPMRIATLSMPFKISGSLRIQSLRSSGVPPCTARMFHISFSTGLIMESPISGWPVPHGGLLWSRVLLNITRL